MACANTFERKTPVISYLFFVLMDFGSRDFTVTF